MPLDTADDLIDALQGASRAPSVLRLRLVGANPTPEVVGLDELAGKSNYFVGNDPAKGRANVPNYAKVQYRDVYPGVDLVYYGNQRQLEYDFVVAPGADPKAITLELVGEGSALPKAEGSARPRAAKTGAQRAPLQIAANGDLVLRTAAGEVRFHKPVVYQPDEGRQWSVVSCKEPRTTDHGRLAIQNPKSKIANFLMAATCCWPTIAWASSCPIMTTPSRLSSIRC